MNNKEKKEYHFKYYRKNKKKMSLAMIKWRKENKDKVNKYFKEKRKDPKFIKLCRELRKKWAKKNPDKIKKYKKDYSIKNSKSISLIGKKWRENNPERVYMLRKNWADKNRDRLRELQKKRCENPKVRIDRTIGSCIRKSLKKKKAGRKWESLVGYTLQDLVKHLEKQFDENMNLENHGSYWHIDHIKPKSLFNYIYPEDPEFKKCWALDNLQPLEARENLRKGNKY